MTERTQPTFTSPRVGVHVTRKHIPCNLCGSNGHVLYRPENGRGRVQCGRWAERHFQMSEWSLYVNPFDIIAITARKRA